jgi:hypothetical protein
MTNEELNKTLLDVMLTTAHPYNISYGLLYLNMRDDAEEQKSIKMREYTGQWMRSLEFLP